MNDVLYTNLFFSITALAVVVFTVFLCIAAYHVIKALRVLRRILDRIDAGADVIAGDVRSVRAFFAEGGFLRRLVSLLTGREGRSREHRTRERRKQDLKTSDE
ncbi:MAG TPA: hypothetical protein VFS75_00530 [Candidatus Paceibacterota bacterium]|nr:hypothetical protein [Candidatus Paceibacterota bacterium]